MNKIAKILSAAVVLLTTAFSVSAQQVPTENFFQNNTQNWFIKGHNTQQGLNGACAMFSRMKGPTIVFIMDLVDGEFYFITTNKQWKLKTGNETPFTMTFKNGKQAQTFDGKFEALSSDTIRIRGLIIESVLPVLYYSDAIEIALPGIPKMNMNLPNVDDGLNNLLECVKNSGNFIKKTSGPI